MHNYIFITGGVLSSLGKGITAGGIAALLEAKGVAVSLLKLDPYLNLDPGTMNPYQHGEVFVTDDGAETDLDLGHYERFSKAILTKNNSVTAGKLYANLLEKERAGVFLGQTIQTIPHFTNEIKEYIYKADMAQPGKKADVTIVEIGGTVGDIEGLPFLEAIRQIHLEKNNRCVFVHVTYVPYIAAAKELKTKPTQHSVKELLSLGIQPDIIIGRSEQPLPEDIKKKIALFTNVDEEAVISAHDLKSIYEIPLVFHKQKLDTVLNNYLKLPATAPDLAPWHEIIKTLYTEKTETVNIALVGKYVELHDAYKSISEALIHAQIPNKVRVNIVWVDAEQITPDSADAYLNSVDAILVPGGFGERGIEGKIETVRYARENNIPFLGICLGMQMAVIEFARNVLGLSDADSKEFNPATTAPVIDLMAEQKKHNQVGGTMRLGAYSCTLAPKSCAHGIYKEQVISERHRHRYEFNTAFIPEFQKQGFFVSGYSAECALPEIIEIPEHQFFIACQFHPEFKSKPFAPHPLFTAFVKAAKEKMASGNITAPQNIF